MSRHCWSNHRRCGAIAAAPGVNSSLRSVTASDGAHVRQRWCVFTRGKAETRWDCSQPTLYNASVLVSGCGRSQMVSTATETKARWAWKSPRWVYQKKNVTVHSVLYALPFPPSVAVSLYPLRACPPSNGCKFMQKTAEIWEDTILMASNAAGIFFFYAHITESHSLLLFFFLLLLPPPPPTPTPTLPLQICVGKNEETDGFLRLSSGKRRGLVPVQCVQELWWRVLPNSLWDEEVHSDGGITQECSTKHLPPFCQDVAMNRIEAWVDTDPPDGFFFSEDLL